jgi:2'-5' RNA ligase
MRLFAAIVPPRGVVDEVLETVHAVRPPSDAAGAHKRGGLLSRFGSGRTATPDAFETDQLSVPSAVQTYLPLTGFGNVTLGDSVQLTKALRTEALTWERPTLHLQGGAALEFPGDESVWAKLEGDVDALHVIGRGVPQIVQRLGFFVDRRQFRPWLSVGTITDTSTAPYLEKVVDALDAFRGQSWTVEHISLMKRLPEEGPDSFEEMEQLPLAL